MTLEVTEADMHPFMLLESKS